ncbi:flagellar FliL protein [Nocardioides salarius]|uniref:Flagellar protein FliL n=1 Tax=Nocardioides salarius TaxID=374513 RepID=A0ABS2MEH8_9ACTN|nr:flagellar basal body-associated FliL family protein [Nocardioides salarius]MBM7509537.1 flagellar FliL protein [Nocardioides salarius]
MPQIRRLVAEAEGDEFSRKPSAGSRRDMVDSPEAATEGRKGALRKKLIVALLLVAVVGGAAYWFLLRPTPVLAPEPGEVVALEPIQVNLADGPYLRVAIALQATLDVEEEVDGSRAFDAAIEVFSRLPVDEVVETKSRDILKSELKEVILELNEGELMDIYSTEFVTQ